MLAIGTQRVRLHRLDFLEHLLRVGIVDRRIVAYEHGDLAYVVAALIAPPNGRAILVHSAAWRFFFGVVERSLMCVRSHPVPLPELVDQRASLFVGPVARERRRQNHPRT